jgi:hypothetical protein
MVESLEANQDGGRYVSAEIKRICKLEGKVSTHALQPQQRNNRLPTIVARFVPKRVREALSLTQLRNSFTAMALSAPLAPRGNGTKHCLKSQEFLNPIKYPVPVPPEPRGTEPGNGFFDPFHLT